MSPEIEPPSTNSGPTQSRGLFRLELRSESSGSRMKKVATSLGGLKRGFLSLSLDGLLLEQRLTFPAAVLIGLGTLVSMGVLGSIVLNALSEPYVPWVAIVSKVSLIAAFVVPPIAVWRTRQFKRRFATCEIGEVTLRNRVFEFVFRDASPSGGPPADFLEPTPTASLQGGLRAKARLRFTVHSKADTHSLARALRDCGFVVGETGNGREPFADDHDLFV